MLRLVGFINDNSMNFDTYFLLTPSDVLIFIPKVLILFGKLNIFVVLDTSTFFAF